MTISVGAQITLYLLVASTFGFFLFRKVHRDRQNSPEKIAEREEREFQAQRKVAEEAEIERLVDMICLTSQRGEWEATNMGYTHRSSGMRIHGGDWALSKWELATMDGPGFTPAQKNRIERAFRTFGDEDRTELHKRTSKLIDQIAPIDLKVKDAADQLRTWVESDGTSEHAAG